VIEYHVPFKIKPVCYLPDNIQGNELLRRLEYAFMNGLTFSVETSTTARLTDQLGSSIPHKTRTIGGTAGHGFPDQAYFDRCNAKLDNLGVPAASDLAVQWP
jgi:Deltex C-terminal domain